MRRTMWECSLLALAAVAAIVPAGARPGEAGGRGIVAVQAGTIHVVEGGRVVHDGTMLIRDGRIVAVEAGIDVPPDARVVDYGPDAVIVPGFVAANSQHGRQDPSDRTADPAVLAADNFDPYWSGARELASGVTSLYVSPARGRLIAGQGAMVKADGDGREERLLSASAALQGSISADARRTPGYWEPPVPATIDVGLGVEQKQLPRTTMGAIVALRELLALSATGADSEEYGPRAGRVLGELVEARRPWRMRAESQSEIRALLGFFRENGLPLVIDGGQHAGELAEEIAAAGASVVVASPVYPNRRAADRGKDEDADWAPLDGPALLAKAGVRFAIAPPLAGPTNELRFYAQVAARQGLGEADALRAITLAPAEILGVADRVGSLAPGKDADFVVLNGAPLASSSSVVATWLEGEIAWKVSERSATVLEVEELHVGDGRVIAPGQLLIEDGRIVEVGRRVGHPLGCTVVRGHAAMPGMIDAMGHLGLEGSGKVPPTDFRLARIVEPGDYADRRVAQAGVTTVVLTPRGTSSSGAPAMAYKPAGEELDHMVVADPAALHLQWSDRDHLESGDSVRKLLQKAVEYKAEWDAYEKAIAEWVPAPPEADDDKADEDKEEEKADDEKGEEGDAEKKGDDDDKDKKKKRKKKGDDEEPAKPVTGVWVAEVSAAEDGAGCRFRLQVEDVDGALSGFVRCDLLSDELVSVTGTRSEHDVSLSGLGTKGAITIEASTKEGKLSGKASGAGRELELQAEQTSTEYRVARRVPRPRVDAEEPPKEPKDKPKEPKRNEDLEPLKRAIEGDGAVVVRVDRDDEILACVDAFEAAGIRPILYGANDAWKVAARIRGRVAGVLLDHRVIHTEAKTGTLVRNRYAELASAGIPVAFHSSAEEGAADLPLIAAYAVSQGMGPESALLALTAGAADMFSIEERVGRLAGGLDADVLLLDGPPLEPSTAVLRSWVCGREVRLK